MSNISKIAQRIEDHSNVFTDIEIVENITLYHSRCDRKVNGYKVSMIDEWENETLLGLDCDVDVEDFEFTPYMNVKDNWQDVYNYAGSSVLFATEEYQDDYGYEVYKIKVSKAMKSFHKDDDKIEFIFCLQDIQDIDRAN